MHPCSLLLRGGSQANSQRGTQPQLTTRFGFSLVLIQINGREISASRRILKEEERYSGKKFNVHVYWNRYCYL